MKLFILRDYLNNIIAISETKIDMITFCLQINFNETKYIVKKITDISKINKYLIKYSDLYLIEYENFIIREKDYKIINDLVYTEMERTKSVLLSLQEISDNYNLNINEQKHINETINILRKKSKNKNFKSFINLNGLINDYFNNKDFRQYMEEMYLKIYE